MRITNSMIMNTSRSNINKNKAAVDRAQYSVTTGMKIQVPSDDPITAIRALKLRNNLNELNQYYEKNVEDATSWMKLTEDSLVGMRTSVKSMYDAYMRGANSSLAAEDRASLKDEIVALREELMGLCNAKAVGRNIFTGYKTSTDFTFMNDERDASYEITQNFTGKDIGEFKYVSGIKGFDRNNITGVLESDMPQENTVYRLNLGYQGIDSLGSFTYVDKTGTSHTITPTTYNLDGTNNDAAYTTVPAGGANFIADTGELILSEDLYNELVSLTPDANGNPPISVTYTKTGFSKYEARPEMYYDCKDLVNNVEYTKEDQEIYYTVNFEQRLKVNTQISDVIGRDLIRNVDDMINALQRVDSAQAKVDEIQDMIDSGRYTGTTLEDLQTHLASAEKELDLQKGILQDVLEAGVGQTQGYEESITVAVTDAGNRSRRLNLIKERLGSQKTNFEDLKATNEKISESDALLDLTAAKLAYESALTATGQIAQISLLNYL